MADLDNKRILAIKAINDAQAEQNRLYAEGLRTSRDMSVAHEEQAKIIAKATKEIYAINLERKKGLKDAESAMGSMSSMYGNLNNLEKERIKNTLVSGKLTNEQTDSLNKMADINRDIAKLSIDDLAGREVLLQQYGLIKDSLGTIDEQDKKILENLDEQNKLAFNYSIMTKNQKEFLQKQLNVYDGIKDTIKGILETASLLTSNLKGAMGAAIIGVGFGLEKWGKSVRSFGGYVDSAQISSVALGLVFKDAEEVTKGLSKEFGGLKDVSFSTQLNTNLMATNMGISGAEAANVVGSFARMNDGSASTAMDMAATTKAMGKAAGVPIDSLMKDVAGSTKAFAEYGKNGGLNIAAAAVAAAKMGVSMDSMTKVTDSLLDFETSINSEMELGAMMGKQLNLDRARGLAYEGNMTGAVKATLDELGGIEAFNKMDIFQKRKAAELLGLSVDEFQKMAANSDKISESGEASVSKWSTFWEGTTAFVTGPLAGMAKTFGSSLIAMGQMSPMLKDMGINMGGMAKSAFEWLKNLIKGKAIETAAGGITESATTSIKDKATDALKDKMGGIAEDKLKGAELPKAGGADEANKFGKIKANDLIKGAAALLILAAALWVSAKAFQEFATVKWEDVGKGLVGLLGLAGIAFILSKASGSMIEGAIAIAILGAALIPFAFAMSLIQGLNIDSVLAAAAGLVLFAVAAAGIGFVLPLILLGAVGIAALGASLIVFGAGMNLMGSGFAAISSSLPGIIEQVSAVSQIDFMPILGLAGALTMLAGALALVAISGLLALPVLMALGGLSVLFGGGGEGGGEGKKDSTAELIEEIKGLRADLNAGKISVHMDGQKVTSRISAVIDKGSTNSYGKH
jgi:hypothetical protein